MMASSAVRMPQLGCHVSLRADERGRQLNLEGGGRERELPRTYGWKLEMERQIFLLTSKRPDGVSM